MSVIPDDHRLFDVSEMLGQFCESTSSSSSTGCDIKSKKRSIQVISTLEHCDCQELDLIPLFDDPEDEERPKKSQKVMSIDLQSRQTATSWLAPHMLCLAVCGQLKFTVSDVSMEMVRNIFLDRASTVILEPEPSKRHRKGARYVFVLTSQDDLDLIFGEGSLTNTTAAIPGQVRADGVIKRITHMTPVKVTYGQRNKKLEVKFGGYLIQQFVVPELVTTNHTPREDHTLQDALLDPPTYIHCSLFTEGEFNSLSAYAKGIVNAIYLSNYSNAAANAKKNLRSTWDQESDAEEEPSFSSFLTQ